MNLFQRINEVRKQAAYVQKDKRVQEGGGYMAVTHDAVTAMLREALIEHGIVITMSALGSSISDTGTVTAKGTPFIRYAARYRVEFINVDEPGDRLTVEVESHALDLGDKAPGKAMSYAKKYAMLKTFEIETGENDEGREEQTARRTKKGSSPTDVKREAYEAMAAEDKAWVDALSVEVSQLFSEGTPPEALVNHIKNALGDADHDWKLAVWYKLDSKVRTALDTIEKHIKR
jgi:hypothetical protein